MITGVFCWCVAEDFLGSAPHLAGSAESHPQPSESQNFLINDLRPGRSLRRRMVLDGLDCGRLQQSGDA